MPSEKCGQKGLHVRSTTTNSQRRSHVIAWGGGGGGAEGRQGSETQKVPAPEQTATAGKQRARGAMGEPRTGDQRKSMQGSMLRLGLAARRELRVRAHPRTNSGQTRNHDQETEMDQRKRRRLLMEKKNSLLRSAVIPPPPEGGST